MTSTGLSYTYVYGVYERDSDKSQWHAQRKLYVRDEFLNFRFPRARAARVFANSNDFYGFFANVFQMLNETLTWDVS